jgi:hypothetical protein
MASRTIHAIPAQLVVLVVLVVLATTLHAQRPAGADSAVLRGAVTGGETGLALPYALVALPSLGLERFANDQGRFAFPRLPAGAYRLRVR